MNTEDRLREALSARADSVEVSPDALPRIRERIAGRRRRHWFSAIGAAVAVATAATVVGLVAYTPPDDHPPTPAGTVTTPAPSVEPSRPPAPSGPASPTGSVAPQTGTLVANVPVYYAGGGRLFREYHELKVTPDTVPGRVVAAVTEMMRPRSPVDPDYNTLWSGSAGVRGVQLDNGIATVDLTSAGTAPADPALAVQQLVYTVAAAVADTPAQRVTGVKLTVDGAPVDRLWGSVDTSGILRPGDVLAPLWLIEPHEGATVGQTFTVHVAGSVFEATSRLRVRGADGKTISDQQVMFDIGAPQRGEKTFKLTLPPGKYTIESYYLSAKDGSEQGLDGHKITVR